MNLIIEATITKLNRFIVLRTIVVRLLLCIYCCVFIVVYLLLCIYCRDEVFIE